MGGIVTDDFIQLEEKWEFLLGNNTHEGVVVCHFGNDETYYPTEGAEPIDADKALICAAPDLLAACERFLNPTEKGPRLEDIMRAAIAKAKGEKP